MANEIITPVPRKTGLTLNCVVKSMSGLQARDVTAAGGAGAWVGLATAVFANCLIAMTELGMSGYYACNLPTGLNTHTRYQVIVYRAGATGFADTEDSKQELYFEIGPETVEATDSGSGGGGIGTSTLTVGDVVTLARRLLRDSLADPDGYLSYADEELIDLTGLAVTEGLVVRGDWRIDGSGGRISPSFQPSSLSELIPGVPRGKANTLAKYVAGYAGRGGNNQSDEAIATRYLGEFWKEIAS